MKLSGTEKQWMWRRLGGYQSLTALDLIYTPLGADSSFNTINDIMVLSNTCSQQHKQKLPSDLFRFTKKSPKFWRKFEKDTRRLIPSVSGDFRSYTAADHQGKHTIISASIVRKNEKCNSWRYCGKTLLGHLIPPENEVFLLKRTNVLCWSGLGPTQRGCSSLRVHDQHGNSHVNI